MHASVLKSLAVVVVVVVAAAVVPRSGAVSVPEEPMLPEDLVDAAAVQLA